MNDVYQNPNSIAVIGMMGQFPGAPNLATFWKNLIDGVNSISFFDQATLAREGVSEKVRTRADYVPARGVLTGIDQFDPEFFNISRREAMIMDPQHRLFLMAAWQALEKAGYDSDRFPGAIGVFAGAMANSYLRRHVLLNKQAQQYIVRRHLTMGNDREFLPTFVSYKLDLHGPSLNVQTACSTSLVAVHLACQSLVLGESDLALAGGVAVSVPHRAGHVYQPGMIKSPDGYCRTFDARAQGTVFGQGLGIVVLKRLDEAIADGDHIHAVIAGSAVNNDGSRKLGYSAPSVEGQATAIREALAMADVEPAEVGMIEAHGTATELGDPTEIASLTKAFGAELPKQTCAIGSVKTNIGHLETAAGMAGLIKAILSLEHQTIPASLHFETPNPLIDFENSPFFVNAKTRSWSANGTRIAGVNSFGVGGTNAHLVVAEAPRQPPAPTTGEPQLLVLSARHREALERARTQLANHLEANPTTPLAHTAFTLAMGRKVFEQRFATVVDQHAQAARRLNRISDDVSQPLHKDRLVFLFPGQGSQYSRMATDLYRAEEEFRTHLDQCAAHLRSRHGFDLHNALFPERDESGTSLEDTAHAQPALLALGYALYRQWLAWGVKPTALVGHSIGELTAACVAGVFDLEDALDLAFERGRLMQSMPTGSMASIGAEAGWVERHLPEGIVIAAINSPKDCVVSGPSVTIDSWLATLTNQGINHQVLATKHAFHSPAMAPAAQAFREIVRGVSRRAPSLPYFSNVSGTWQAAEQAMDPDYWARHLLAPVRFADHIEQLIAQGPCLLIELGPGLGLGSAAKRHPDGSQLAVRASLPGRRRATHDLAVIYQTLGDLWCAGYPIDWQAFYRGKPKRRVPLPTYPFDLASYWVDPSRETPQDTPRAPAAKPKRKSNPEQWAHEPLWVAIDGNQAPTLDRTVQDLAGSSVLIYADSHGLGETLAERFRDQSQRGDQVGDRRVSLVFPGQAYLEQGDDRFQIDPAKPSHHDRLMKTLAENGHLPSTVIHCWALTQQVPREGDLPSDEQLATSLQTEFYSLFYLAAALARSVDHGEQHHRLITVANHTQAVLAHEPLRPFSAAQHGLIRILNQEHQAIQAVHMDFDSWEGAALPTHWSDYLVALANQPNLSEAYLALRGTSYYRLSYPELPLPKLQEPLEYPGRYLITGGLGGLGLCLAEHLAEHGADRVVLTSRHPFPARQDWSAWARAWADPRDLTIAPPPSFQRWSEDDQANYLDLEHHLRETIGFRGLFRFEGAEQALAHTSCCLILDYFQQGGVRLAAGTQWSRQQLIHDLSIQAPYDKMLDAFLGILALSGYVKPDGERWQVQASATDYGLGHEWCRHYAQRYPKFEGVLRLMAHCAGNYPQALSGQIPAISVLYPRGDGQFLAGFLRDTHHFNNQRLYSALMQDILVQLARRKGKEPLRILEVGGGGGGLTWKLVPALQHLDIAYTFTDLGATFVRSAREKAQANDWLMMDFGVLDITRDSRPQGFAHAEFDVVLGLNVVHATPDVCQSLTHIHQLLRPDGMLMLVESCKTEPWMDMTWGTAEGWWYFEDETLRPNSPLMGLDVWEHALDQVGFDRIHTFPRDRPARDQTDRGLMLAHRKSSLDRHAVRARVVADHQRVQPLLTRILEMEAKGVQIDVVTADVADQAAMTQLIETHADEDQPIRGVIHAAGVADGRMLANRDTASIERVFRAKLHGSLVLERLFSDRDLDFLAYCSTLHTVVGGRGKLAHTASGAVMDALAHAGRPPARLAIDWDAWRDVGQAAAAQKRDQQPQLLPLDHRLFVARLDSPEEVVFRLHLDPARDWLLGEHLLAGTPTLPGTAYVSLVHEAWRLMYGSAACELSQVNLRKPLAVPHGDQVRVEVRFTLHEGEPLDFAVWAQGSNQPAWRRYADGRIAKLTEEPESFPTAIDQIEVSALAPMIVSDNRGPRWRCEREGFVGERYGHQRLNLDPTFADDTRLLSLHPAQLDVASGFLARARMGGRFVPMAFERICLYGPPDTPSWVVDAFFREDQNLANHSLLQDVFIADDSGKPCLVIEGYALRAVTKHSTTKPGTEKNLAVVMDRATEPPFYARTIPRPKPKVREVEIEVSHVGLNFKDILRSLGLMSDRRGGKRLGMECSGRIVAVGEEVDTLAPGDEVVAFASPATQRFVCVEHTRVFKRPAILSAAEAATLPIAFLTAEWALSDLGRIQVGERVLIHCASGGVGLAAVQVARAAGAVVMATAGSEEKRAYLKSLGIDWVMDSRSTDYADRIANESDGHGVDLVLNALSGEHVRLGCSILAPGGRFLDLARHVGEQAQTANLAAIAANRAYFSVTAGTHNPNFQVRFRNILDRIERQRYRPLPHTCFPTARMAEGHQLLAKAGHIGKVVIEMTDVSRLPLRDTDSNRSTESARSAKANDKGGLSPQQGVEIFARALHTGKPRIIVATETHAVMTDPADDSLADASFETETKQPRPSKQSRRPQGEALRSELASLWCDFLGLEELTPQKSFLDLGGDSLLALQMVDRIDQRLGVKLSSYSLLHCSSFANLENEILSMSGDAGTDQNLISLSGDKDDQNPRLFLIHPVEGGISCYRPLAKALGDHCGVAAIQDSGLLGTVNRADTLPARARDYLRILRGVQSRGPYRLGGFSFGGLVAYEMACQLAAEGQTPPPLLMFDTFPPQAMTADFEKDETIMAFLLADKQSMTESHTQLETMNREEQVAYFLATWGLTGPQNQMAARQWVVNLLQVFRENLRMARAYQPSPYPGEVVYFQAATRLPGFPKEAVAYWRNLLGSKLTVHPVTAHHLNLLQPAAIATYQADLEHLFGRDPAT